MSSTDNEGLRSLDRAFDLPEEVCPDPKLRELYEVLVARMRDEGKNLVLSTVNLLLIERIAFNYIVLRMKEQHAVGSKEGFASASVQKDYNTFWLAMTREFNAMVSRANKTDRTAIFGELQDIILKVSKVIEDKNVRDAFLIALSDEIEKSGV